VKAFQSQTLYEVLEISVGATAEEIRSAFERLSRLYGQDQLALYGLIEPSQAEALQRRLQEALEVLGDDARRDAYDLTIGLPPRELPATSVPASPGAAEEGPGPPALPAPPAPGGRATSGPGTASLSSAGWSRGYAWVTPEAATAPAAEPGPGGWLVEASPPAPAPVPPPAVDASRSAPEEVPLPGGSPGAGPARPAAEEGPRAPPEGPQPGPPALPPLRASSPEALPARPAVVEAPPERPPSPEPPPREVRTESKSRVHEIPAGVEFNGDLLRQVRLARGVSLHQISERTRISTRHLENLEADRYDALPANVYLRGILMSVARELGLDGLRVARSYLQFVDAHRLKG